MESSAPLLLAGAFVLSQWSDLGPARWLLRGLPLWALLVLLALPRARRAQVRLSAPLLAFSLWCVVSITWSADPDTSVHRLADLLALVTAGWLAGQVCGRAVVRILARAVRVVLVATVVTLLVAPGWATAAGADGAPGWHGLFPHKNGLGFFCAFAAVTLWTQLPPGRSRWMWVGLVVVLLLGSESASALAATATAAVVLVWSTARGRRAAGPARLVVDTAAATLLGLLVAVAVLRPGWVLEALGRDDSLTGRRAIWTAVLHHTADRPLVGQGFGGVWGENSPVTLALWRESRFDAFYAHNGWLDVLLQVGWVGLVLLGLLLITLSARAVRTGGRTGGWALGVLALLLVTAMTESSPFTGNGLFLLALLAGCLGRLPTGEHLREAQPPSAAAVPGRRVSV